ncbi:hypothetical protein PF005_g25377 [Phytophthora fragariae]|nr:hypothetical protein PF006_g24687 [Phytophthora fragariae]KAE9175497.1 hypothetical protein PF005_g25377 [Phytophthora fragariae]
MVKFPLRSGDPQMVNPAIPSEVNTRLASRRIASG